MATTKAHNNGHHEKNVSLFVSHLARRGGRRGNRHTLGRDVKYVHVPSAGHHMEYGAYLAVLASAVYNRKQRCATTTLFQHFPSCVYPLVMPQVVRLGPDREVLDCMLDLSTQGEVEATPLRRPQHHTGGGAAMGCGDGAKAVLASAARCQYDGKGSFLPCWLELLPPSMEAAGAASSPAVLVLRETAAAAVARSVSLGGASVGRPKSERKGEPHVFRLDVPAAGTQAAQKLVVSVGTTDDLAAWADLLGCYCHGHRRAAEPAAAADKTGSPLVDFVAAAEVAAAAVAAAAYAR